jgi:predicted tellurium resistance membrane protein TerC
MMWLKQQIVAWWHWSRMVFLNAASLLAAIGTELIGYAVGANWASAIDNPKLLFWWLMAINVANILLRLDTRGPVGGRE